MSRTRSETSPSRDTSSPRGVLGRIARLAGSGAAATGAWVVALGLVLCQPNSSLAQTDIAAATLMLSHPTVSVQQVSSDSAPSEAADRPLPEWIQEGNFVDETGTEYVVVGSDRFFRQRESQQDLHERVIAVLREKLDDLIALGAGKAILIDAELVNRITVPGRQHLVVHAVDEFEDLPDQYRTMYSCYTQVRLDDEFVSWANTAWEDQLVRSRLLQTALIGGLVVGLLAVTFGYFQLDRATRGYYSGRLQTTCLAAVILMIAFGLAASRAFLWI